MSNDETNRLIAAARVLRNAYLGDWLRLPLEQIEAFVATLKAAAEGKLKTHDTDT